MLNLIELRKFWKINFSPKLSFFFISLIKHLRNSVRSYFSSAIPRLLRLIFQDIVCKMRNWYHYHIRILFFFFFGSSRIINIDRSNLENGEYKNGEVDNKNEVDANGCKILTRCDETRTYVFLRKIPD